VLAGQTKVYLLFSDRLACVTGGVIDESQTHRIGDKKLKFYRRRAHSSIDLQTPFSCCHPGAEQESRATIEGSNKLRLRYQSISARQCQVDASIAQKKVAQRAR
jgi:hypothetical protein